MREVTVWEASDGMLFNQEEECKQHEENTCIYQNLIQYFQKIEFELGEAGRVLLLEVAKSGLIPVEGATSTPVKFDLEKEDQGVYIVRIDGEAKYKIEKENTGENSFKLRNYLLPGSYILAGTFREIVSRVFFEEDLLTGDGIYNALQYNAIIEEAYR